MFYDDGYIEDGPLYVFIIILFLIRCPLVFEI